MASTSSEGSSAAPVTFHMKNLDSDDATEAFLRECIEIKSHFHGVFRGTVENMRTISSALYLKHHIDVTIEQCQKKKKGIWMRVIAEIQMESFQSICLS